MAISTLDGAAAGARQLAPIIKATTGTTSGGRTVSTWGLAGVPGAGSYSGSLAGATLSHSDAGALTRANPATGNSYLHAFTALAAGQTGVIMLIDRLWNNGGITINSTSTQTVNSVTWPSRCPTSASDDTPSTDGHGVLLGVEVSSVTGSGTPTLTVGYTNSAGTSGRTGTSSFGTTASAPAATFYPIGLQGSDIGVRSVQSLALSATWTSGTINMVAYRILAAVPVSPGGVPPADFLSLGGARIYDGACLSLLWVPVATTAVNIVAAVTETQG